MWYTYTPADGYVSCTATLGSIWLWPLIVEPWTTSGFCMYTCFSCSYLHRILWYSVTMRQHPQDVAYFFSRRFLATLHVPAYATWAESSQHYAADDRCLQCSYVRGSSGLNFRSRKLRNTPAPRRFESIAACNVRRVHKLYARQLKTAIKRRAREQKVR